MLEFRDIEISDKDRINAALRRSGFLGCEYSFANNMAWKRLSDSKIAFLGDFYISCGFGSEDGIPSFTFPTGSDDYDLLFTELRRFTDSIGKPLRIRGITDELLPLFNERFKGQFTCQYDRDESDYIYSSADLISLSGKKYHSKRNHLARFNELKYEFSPITDRDIDDCIAFTVKDYIERSGENDHSLIAEQYAINTFFMYFNELELKGGVIRIDGKPAAVSIGERCFGDDFIVHIEKGDTRYNGIYAGINNLCAREFACDMKYINREEDLGLEGLRKSKLSYKPIFLLNKYTVTFM